MTSSAATPNPRTPEFGPIEPQFLNRHSPRAMSGAPVPREDLMRVMEAARWAPSSGNGQPWRFVMCELGGTGFAIVVANLMGFNQVWAKNAAAFVVVCTETTRVDHEGKVTPRRLAAFDAGAAWMSMALQGKSMGLVLHGMEGFNREVLAPLLKVPEGIDVLAVIAVGLPGVVEDLPADKQAGEVPNQRRPTSESVVFNSF